MADPYRILVLDRGFVLIARCPEPSDHAFWLPVENSHTFRVWGTAGVGLGALCAGPLPGTILDTPVPKESIPIRAILRILEAEQSSWVKRLKN